MNVLGLKFEYDNGFPRDCLVVPMISNRLDNGNGGMNIKEIDDWCI